MGSDDSAETKYVRWFAQVDSGDVGSVGGKNASLGEMVQKLHQADIRVPDGFATTADAYWALLKSNDLIEAIEQRLDSMQSSERSLHETGEAIRKMIRKADIPGDLSVEILGAYRELGRRYEDDEVDVAVRSSATAEDLPNASFAGQQESFLNVSGRDEVLDAFRRCCASLFTDRAISYREQNGFEHMKVALSVGIQKMVRSDRASAGVMFTIDTETGFPSVVVIDAAWGLGENVVQGTVSPDEYRVFKPLLERSDLMPIIEKSLGDKEKRMVYAKKGSQDGPTRQIETPQEDRTRFALSDDEILQLGRWAAVIEQHYDRPMDIEWAKDGDSGRLFIVQARPETVRSRAVAGVLKNYELKERSEVLLRGLAIGDAIAAGKVCVLASASEAEKFETGSILVTEMTDPDWVPIMRRAAGLVTEHGGRTSHAAIVSRELGLPAVIGTGSAKRELSDGQEVTVSCAEGDTGVVYEGCLEFEEEQIDITSVPETQTRIMLNLASPDAAFHWWKLPAHGIGLARMEFVLNHSIRTHPMALLEFEKVEDEGDRRAIEALTRGFESKPEYFVDRLARDLAKIAASEYPDPVIVRFSDFKTNEYADLIGGKYFEPSEENPMLGFRGASRYYNPKYRPAFELECEAIRRAREDIGLDNIRAMVPFCRSLAEADRVLQVMADAGLARGRNGFQLYVMVEIPANVILAEEFAERFDGFSIGSNDLTQLVLGVDRDSEELASLFDENNEAVRVMIRQAIDGAHEAGIPIGFCGQAPSDHPEFARFLVECGIDSISVVPTSLIAVANHVAQAEKERG